MISSGKFQCIFLSCPYTAYTFLFHSTCHNRFVLKMAKYVEGDWKEFEFHMIEPSADLTAILEHVQKNFYISTPLTSGLGYSKEYFDEFDKIYKEVIPQGLSFYVLDKTTQEIVGARITFVHTRELDRKFASFNFQTPQMKTMNLIMGTVNKEANIFERFGVDSFFNFYTACVDPRYQGQGIAGEMYNRGLTMLRNNKTCTLVKSNLTSPWTRRICEKNGFTELSRAYYNDFRDEKTGLPLLAGKSDDEFVANMILKLD